MSTTNGSLRAGHWWKRGLNWMSEKVSHANPTRQALKEVELAPPPDEVVRSASVSEIVHMHPIQRTDPSSVLLEYGQEGGAEASLGVHDQDTLAANVTTPSAAKANDQLKLRIAGIKNTASEAISELAAIGLASAGSIQTWRDQRSHENPRLDELQETVNALRGKLSSQQLSQSRKYAQLKHGAVELIMLAGEWAISYISVEAWGLTGLEAMLYASVIVMVMAVFSRVLNYQKGRMNVWMVLLTTVFAAITLVAITTLASARVTHLSTLTSEYNATSVPMVGAATNAPQGIWEMLTAGEPVIFVSQVTISVLIPIALILYSYSQKDPDADLYFKRLAELREKEALIHVLNQRINQASAHLISVSIEMKMVAARALTDISGELPLAKLAVANFNSAVARELAHPEVTVSAAQAYEQALDQFSESAEGPSDIDIAFFKHLMNSFSHIDAIVAQLEEEQENYFKGTGPSPSASFSEDTEEVPTAGRAAS